MKVEKVICFHHVSDPNDITTESDISKQLKEE
jgi:hypothetical protein